MEELSLLGVDDMLAAIVIATDTCVLVKSTILGQIPVQRFLQNAVSSNTTAAGVVGLLAIRDRVD